MATQAVDETRLEELMGQVVNDMAAASSGEMVRIGDRLGLYRAMAGAGPLSPTELAQRTGTSERMVREWLSNQAAGGYVGYDPASERFELSAEQAMVLADEDSPVFVAGAFELVASLWADEDKLVEAFRTGEGLGWHEHDHRLFAGTERFFRPGYRGHLVPEWIPALEGVEPKLRDGAKVADIGCGHGASTLLMAEAFPASTFFGLDYHDESIEAARRAAEEAGLGGRASFGVDAAKELDGGPYDLVCAFDCLHDMGDPVGAARAVLEQLAPDGTFMLVEPQASDRLEDNLHPVGRLFYAGSTMICTPHSMSQEVGLALGAQAGEERLAEVLREAGFGEVRRAAETPFNLILEARPPAAGRTA